MITDALFDKQKIPTLVPNSENASQSKDRYTSAGRRANKTKLKARFSKLNLKPATSRNRPSAAHFAARALSQERSPTSGESRTAATDDPKQGKRSIFDKNEGKTGKFRHIQAAREYEAKSHGFKKSLEDNSRRK